ncbi:MAG: paraquat-inducible protein A [Candidatus Omnitrophica bacterium]|nr:paraquat-inducible protein A [Candidatus Omnitrophota bacterium]
MPTSEPQTRRARSLMERHPRQLIVPVALLLSTLLLLLGLSLPLMDAQTGILWTRWKSSYSVWAGVVALWHSGEYALAAVVFFFSIAFPLAKLLALAVLWLVRLGEHQRETILRWLELLGKWSMLDVFAVAILIVLVKLGPLANIQPRVGVYYFTAAIVASMLTTMYVTHIAHTHHH